MSDLNRNTYAYGTGVARAGTAELDQGLRAFMLGVYNHMVLGLAITGQGPDRVDGDVGGRRGKRHRDDPQRAPFPALHQFCGRAEGCQADRGPRRPLRSPSPA